MDISILRLIVEKSFTLCTFYCCGSLYLFLSEREETFLLMVEQGTDLWVQQNVVRYPFVAMFLQQNSSIRFQSRFLSYLVLGTWPFKRRHGFNFMQWTLTQIIYWLVAPTALFHYCTRISCRLFTLEDPRVCIWVGIYLYFLVAYRVPSSNMHTNL